MKAKVLIEERLKWSEEEMDRLQNEDYPDYTTISEYRGAIAVLKWVLEKKKK